MNEEKIEQVEQMVETEIPKVAEEKEPEWQEQLEGMLKNAYLSGISKGGKTFIGVLYEHILEYEKKKMNPAKIIMHLKADCCKMLGTLSTKNEPENKSKEDNAEVKNENE